MRFPESKEMMIIPCNRYEYSSQELKLPVHSKCPLSPLPPLTYPILDNKYVKKKSYLLWLRLMLIQGWERFRVLV